MSPDSLPGTSWAESSVGEAEYERIRSGIPRILMDIGPEDLPQEGALEHSAVSFNKGCYLGQEVMARLHAMGRVNRCLYQVQFSGEIPSLPAEIMIGQKTVGQLRSAALEGKHTIGLALLKHRFIDDAETVQLKDGRLLESVSRVSV